ncbi:MAG: PfkB family carbohydrate kinase, partial [Flavobacterium sp.]
MKNIDILCIGETLIDFIGNETDATLQQTSGYKRLLGGSPTNVAFNAAKLGLRAAIVSTVGNDGL